MQLWQHNNRQTDILPLLVALLSLRLAWEGVAAILAMLPLDCSQLLCSSSSSQGTDVLLCPFRTAVRQDVLTERQLQSNALLQQKAVTCPLRERGREHFPCHSA